MTAADRDARRASLAAALGDIQERIAALKDAETTIKAQILDTTDGPGTFDAGALTVVVTQAARIDPAEVAAKYPPDSHPELYELVPSVAKVRKHIAPVDLEPLFKLAKPSVSIR
ncbi:hypothetical protein ACPPVT_07650 [Angustibacter sp. McL0619]|uniref:hypothetical protein n=1 Tax=Angustibacter sp. McL0619 TaxID=3415676 RepID=UPI003CF33506